MSQGCWSRHSAVTWEQCCAGLGRGDALINHTRSSAPSEKTAIETMRPSEPSDQSRRWSQMALAAEAAEESLRAAMIAAPRFWMVVRNSPSR
eukprot:scaffold203979_cov36-Tisochrysis_lutea.AAC.2